MTYLLLICLVAQAVAVDAIRSSDLSLRELLPMPEDCEQAIKLYRDRVQEKATVELTREEWSVLLQGYNSCVDALQVTEAMKQGIDWAVECACVEGDDPECSTENPTIPKPIQQEASEVHGSKTASQSEPSGEHQESGSENVEQQTSAPEWVSEEATFITGLWHGVIWPLRVYQGKGRYEPFFETYRSDYYKFGFYLTCWIGGLLLMIAALLLLGLIAAIFGER